MQGGPPQETFPSIGTVENPAIFYDGAGLLLCYEVAQSEDGGNVVLQFSDVVFFEKNSNNVHEGLGASKYPVRAWDFTEVFGSDRTERWKVLGRRFWTISFNDVMIEVVFAKVGLVHQDHEPILPKVALLNYLAASCQPELVSS